MPGTPVIQKMNARHPNGTADLMIKYCRILNLQKINSVESVDYFSGLEVNVHFTLSKSQLTRGNISEPFRKCGNL